MKFELTYANGTKIQVEVPDPELREWLRAKAIQAANIQAEIDRAKWGIVTALRVV